MTENMTTEKSTMEESRELKGHGQRATTSTQPAKWQSQKVVYAEGFQKTGSKTNHTTQQPSSIQLGEVSRMSHLTFDVICVCVGNLGAHTSAFSIPLGVLECHRITEWFK